MSIPKFDQLHVISDIHLGGLPGFQIFNQGPALAWTIDQLAAEVPDSQLALVLNGDVVDFLAEEPSTYFDPHGAVRKLERIYADPAFSPVWEALNAFLARPNRHLVVVLGNHDVELALPEVQESLRARLCSDDTARGRLTLALEGNGYACEVGGKSVLCVHGNEIDPWNVVDFFALDKTIRALNRKADLPKWTPNAGTMMVIDVMNSIKRKFQWVDLLKPETEPVPALLVALDSTVLSKLAKLPALAARLATDKVRMSTGFLSAESDESGNVNQVGRQNLEDILGKSFSVPLAQTMETDMDKALGHVEEMLSRNVDPQSMVEKPGEEQFLGFGGALIDKILGRPPQKNVREALQKWMSSDKTWDPFAPDDTFKNVDAMTGPGVDFAIAGHTHLHRALQRQQSSGYYYNSGTWIRLIKLTEAMLNDDATFDKLWKVLEKGSMVYLDDPSQLGITDLQVVEQIRSLVSIRSLPNGVVGSLNTVEGKSAADFEIKTVVGSEYRR